MRELTENEKLAQLVGGGNEEAEQYSSADLLTRNLMKNLSVNPATLAEVKREIISSGAEMENTPLASFSANGRSVHTPSSTEPTKDIKLIGTLKVVHQGMVDVFERSGLNSVVEKNMVTLIDAVGACLNYLGEPTNKFEPLKHLSGLQAPNMSKSASKVIETTLACYKIGSIIDPQIKNDGKHISIVFAGKSGNIEYKAFGEVSAASWEGSEAIDYIYTPGSGKMSVKAFENGKWVDRSDSRNYTIRWELEENDTSLIEQLAQHETNLEPPPQENDTQLKERLEANANNSTSQELEVNISEKKDSKIEEVSSLSSKYDDDDEEIAFPIDE